MIQLRRRLAVATLRSGRTVIGTVALSWPWTLRLRDVRIAEPGGEPRTADGTVSIPRSALDFVQYVT